MAEDFNEKLRRIGKTATGNTTESILKKFNKDFDSKMEKIIDYMASSNQREIEDRKSRKLQDIANKQLVSNIADSNKINTTAGKAAMKGADSAATTEILKQLKSINVTLQEGQNKANDITLKQRKRASTAAILQAQLVNFFVTKAKEFFLEGPNLQLQTIHAIENVEKAVRGQDSIQYDNRGYLEKLFDQLKENNADVAKFIDSIPNKEDIQDAFVSGSIDAIKKGKAAFTEASQTHATNIKSKTSGLDIGSIFEDFKRSFENISKDQKRDRKTQSDSFDNFSRTVKSAFGVGAAGAVAGAKVGVAGAKATAEVFNEQLGKLFSKGLKEKAKNGAWNTAIWTFGDTLDLSLTKAILAPIKSIKLGSWALRKVLVQAGEQPFTRTITAIGSLFGPGSAAAAIIPLAIHKFFYKFVFKPMSTDHKDLFSAMGKFMKKGFKSSGEKLGKFGAAMIVGMETLMAAAIAAWPLILGAVIIGALAGVGYYIYQNWDKVKDKWYEYIVDPVSDAMMSVMDGITSIFTGIGDKIEKFVKDNPIYKFFFGDITKTADTTAKESTAQKDSQKGGVIDRSQAMAEKVKMEKVMQQPTPVADNTAETNKLLKDMHESMKKQNANSAQQTPAPSPNVEDLGTFIAIQNS